MLQACLNGARTPREHHHLPVRPEHLAKAAADSRAAGATEIHLHPKTPDGADSLDPHLLASTLRAVRAAVPDAPIGITTGAWVVPGIDERLAAIRSWSILPDHASVNWHEPGADRVAELLHERGIGVEAGIFSGTDAVERFERSSMRGHVRRVLAEITDRTARGAPTTADALLHQLGTTPAPVLLHGESAGAWPVLRIAVQRGFDARIGLEDTLQLPDGTIASDNAELVTAAEHLRQGH